MLVYSEFRDSIQHIHPEKIGTNRQSYNFLIHKSTDFL